MGDLASGLGNVFGSAVSGIGSLLGGASNAVGSALGGAAQNLGQGVASTGDPFNTSDALSITGGTDPNALYSAGSQLGPNVSPTDVATATPQGQQAVQDPSGQIAPQQQQDQNQDQQQQQRQQQQQQPPPPPQPPQLANTGGAPMDQPPPGPMGFAPQRQSQQPESPFRYGLGDVANAASRATTTPGWFKQAFPGSALAQVAAPPAPQATAPPPAPSPIPGEALADPTQAAATGQIALPETPAEPSTDAGDTAAAGTAPVAPPPATPEAPAAPAAPPAAAAPPAGYDTQGGGQYGGGQYGGQQGGQYGQNPVQQVLSSLGLNTPGGRQALGLLVGSLLGQMFGHRRGGHFYPGGGRFGHFEHGGRFGPSPGFNQIGGGHGVPPWAVHGYRPTHWDRYGGGGGGISPLAMAAMMAGQGMDQGQGAPGGPGDQGQDTQNQPVPPLPPLPGAKGADQPAPGAQTDPNTGQPVPPTTTAGPAAAPGGTTAAPGSQIVGPSGQAGGGSFILNPNYNPNDPNSRQYIPDPSVPNNPATRVPAGAGQAAVNSASAGKNIGGAMGAVAQASGPAPEGFQLGQNPTADQWVSPQHVGQGQLAGTDTPPTPGYSSTMRAVRAPWFARMTAHDRLLAAGMMSAENARDPIGPMESLANRAAANGMTMGQLLRSHFYGPGASFERRGNQIMRSGQMPHYEAVMAAVQNGSNVLGGATDQGSGRDPNVGWSGGRVRRSGEVYNDWGGGHGHAGNAAWRRAIQQKVRQEGRTASSGPINLAMNESTAQRAGLNVTPTTDAEVQQRAAENRAATAQRLLRILAPAEVGIAKGLEAVEDMTPQEALRRIQQRYNRPPDLGEQLGGGAIT